MVKKHKALFLEDSKGVVKLNDKIGNIFVTSDEQIKEGDWLIATNIIKECGFRAIAKADKEQLQCIKEGISAEKIIATTDSSLIIAGTEKWIYPQHLSQPSPQFIQAYIEAYNAGNPIVDVMVEYEEVIGRYSKSKDDTYFIPKIDKNNYITITKCKESWSREEVIHIIKRYNNQREDGLSLSKWIEDNI